MNWKNNCLLFAGAAAGAFSIKAADPRPNIILFVVDDMGVMDTSLPFLTDGEGNGVEYPLNRRYRTPNMERLAERGMRFSTFYAQSVSSPSRVSLLTGQNAARHRTTNWIRSEERNSGPFDPADWNWDGLDSSVPTLPKLLQKDGYRTIHVGKAHLGRIGSDGEDPRNLGYDVNIAGSSIGEPGSYFGENGYGLTGGYKPRAVPGLDKYHGTDTFLTEALTREAMEAIDRTVEEGKPMFMCLSHYAVHNPFESDPRFIGNYTDPAYSTSANGYATLIEGMDKSLGDIMDHLEKRGIADNTLLIFMGDNGSDAPLGDAKGHYSSAPLRGKKGSEYEGGVRAPFIVAWAQPDSTSEVQKRLPVKSGAIQRQLATIMDVYPTVLDLAGIEKPADHITDGVNLAPQLVSDSASGRPEIFMMHFPHEHRGSYFTTYRDGDWKLIYRYNPARPEHPVYELYNLSADPWEIHDLSTENAEKTVEMTKAMASKLMEEGGQYPVDKDGKELRPVI